MPSLGFTPVPVLASAHWSCQCSTPDYLPGTPGSDQRHHPKRAGGTHGDSRLRKLRSFSSFLRKPHTCTVTSPHDPSSVLERFSGLHLYYAQGSQIEG